MLVGMFTDLRTAARSLARSRGFATAAITTLGLGVALCAAVLLVLNAYLFRTLPYPAAERLYGVRFAAPGQPQPANLALLDWQTVDDVIEHRIAWDLDVFYLIGGDRPESAPGAWVTPGFVQGLGIQPAIGPGFGADAFSPGGSNVALISDRLWRSRYAADPNIVGRRFDAYVSDRPDEAEAFTIVGVLPANFWHVNPYTDVLVPLRARTYPYMVRLREGAQPDVAIDRITTLVRAGTTVPGGDWRVALVSTHEGYVERLRPILRSVAIAAGLVLLVALANVAGLLLVRTTRRQKEIAVRRALGASRLAIAKLLIVEGLLLGAGAAILGVIAGGLLMQWLAPVIQRELGRTAPGGLGAFALDLRTVTVAAACGLAAALACTVAPLLASWRLGLQGSLHGGGRGATEGRGSQRVRSALIAVEIAASLSLLAGSTLMMRSVINLLDVDFGLEPANVLSVPMTLRQRTYPQPADRLGFYERALGRVQAIPGVQSVGMTDWWPLQAPQPRQLIVERAGGRAEGRAGIITVTPDYFAALGIAVASGRAFTPRDRLGLDRVVVVSETLARRLWPGGGAIGARVTVVEGAQAEQRSTTHEVVGVVRDVRQTPEDDDLADLYVPLLQSPGRFAWMYVKTSGAPVTWMPQIQSAFREIDPEISFERATPLQTAIDQQLARPKFLAWLLGGFSIVAALLSLVGVYGVIAYAVRQREREIAVRIAVGADARRITRLFVRQGSVVLAAGVALGLAGAVGAGRALESQLFGVAPHDPQTLLLTTIGFSIAGYLAMWWPARRAASTAPAEALKEG
jgi:putative ABC transport system permease protein